VAFQFRSTVKSLRFTLDIGHWLNSSALQNKVLQARRLLARLTRNSGYVRLNTMRAARLQDSLERLTAAIRDVESELAAMKAEHDPLASHIFISRRQYRNVNDTKSGKRRETMARLSFNTACELGFRGGLDEWNRLMGAVARR
jgi:septal ring factor EnvC (AmiA/AmiB activator)